MRTNDVHEVHLTLPCITKHCWTTFNIVNSLHTNNTHEQQQFEGIGQHSKLCVHEQQRIYFIGAFVSPWNSCTENPYLLLYQNPNLFFKLWNPLVTWITRWNEKQWNYWITTWSKKQQKHSIEQFPSCNECSLFSLCVYF